MMAQLLSTPLTTLPRRRFLQITAAMGAAVLAGGLLTPALTPAATTVQVARTLMGTRVHLTVSADDQQTAQQAMTATFAAMERLIAIFDHRQPASPVATLNRQGYLAAAPVELIDLLQRASAFGELTGGAFDVTVKPLLDARQTGADLTGLRALVDFRQIAITDHAVRLAIPGAAITLDGIAKGRVIDGGVETLRHLGFDHVLVEAGGDLRTLGARAAGAPWRVGIAHPRQAAGALLAVLPVTTTAVATSGDYLNRFTADYSQHHIIDPHSGQSPVDLAGATVLAATAMAADALSTALMVLGSAAGLALAERLPAVEAVLVTKDLRVLKTSGVAMA
ncbi:MAG: FAD:protein FMN transferase [Caldilinea sp. CFX5]|nr:FAD:protein FMN transferase [Caldilinea sp. CFX5]